MRYGKGEELCALGTLAGCGAGTDEIVETVLEISDYLAGHKGFGNWSLGKEMRQMFAALLASDILNETGNTDVIGGTVAATIAEQIAIAIVVASSSAAVSTANNG